MAPWLLASSSVARRESYVLIVRFCRSILLGGRLTVGGKATVAGESGSLALGEFQLSPSYPDIAICTGNDMHGHAHGHAHPYLI